MITDPYGQIILTEQEMCDLYMKDPDARIRQCLLSSPVTYSTDLELINAPVIMEHVNTFSTIEEFDSISSNVWRMPLYYKNFDIAEYVLDKCTTDEELQRAGHELIEFEKRDLFMLLRYLKYLVDTMRQNNILWGVGRGSSVSSFVLYLIEIHRINPLYYDLPFEEFIK